MKCYLLQTVTGVQFQVEAPEPGANVVIQCGRLCML